VDDNPANLRTGKNVLGKKYKVATSPSIEKMFMLLENNSPDMVLIKSDMVTGCETEKMLKKAQETKDIPVIFIPEPFEPSNLIACVENHR